MAGTRNSTRVAHCSFCGNAQTRSNRLISGPGRAFVCYQCVRVFHQVIEQDTKEQVSPRSPRPHKLPTPKELHNTLGEYVIGQTRARVALSVAVYNHYKRACNGQGASDVELQKANILVVGPTGSGKTLLARTLARILDVPFAICDATSFTESGYVGEDVENILLRLIQNADWDIKMAEQGIVYIDEIDKIARKEGANRSITRDVSGEGVQQELLKLLEGCTANVPPQGGRKHPYQEFLQIKTDNILFICGGTFDGIESIVTRRVGSGGDRLGFRASSGGTNGGASGSSIIPSDLVQYGFIPEMVGRLPVTVMLDPLDEDSLVQVLTQPKDAIVRQYQQIFTMDNVELMFTPEALRTCAVEAMRRRTGARGLRAIIEEALMQVMFELPSLQEVATCVVDSDSILGHTRPLLTTATGEVVELPHSWEEQRSA